MDANLLQTLSGLTKPATLFVEKVSNALGRHFDPHQMIRMARATAEADRILRLAKAETDIEASALYQRATSRLFHEQVQEQTCMETIVEQACLMVTDDASPEDMEDDWIRNLLGKCRIVSDQDMQELWARILAGEANEPGSVSRRTVNLVADLDKRDAESFMAVCRFVWQLHFETIPVIIDRNHCVYKQYNFDVFKLRECGLLTIGGASFALALGPLPKQVIASYFEKELNLILPEEDGNSMYVGEFRFTTTGLELLKVCESEPAEAFFDYICSQWVAQQYLPSTEQHI